MLRPAVYSPHSAAGFLANMRNIAIPTTAAAAELTAVGTMAAAIMVVTIEAITVVTLATIIPLTPITVTAMLTVPTTVTLMVVTDTHATAGSI